MRRRPGQTILHSLPLSLFISLGIREGARGKFLVHPGKTPRGRGSRNGKEIVGRILRQKSARFQKTQSVTIESGMRKVCVVIAGILP